MSLKIVVARVSHCTDGQGGCPGDKDGVGYG